MSINFEIDSRLRQEDDPATSGAYSMAMWVKPEDLSAIVGDDRSFFLNNVILLDMNSAGRVRMRDNGGTVFPTIEGTGLLTTGTWHHIVCSVSPTLARLAVDGVSIGTSVVTSVGNASGYHFGETANGFAAEYDSPLLWKFGISLVDIETLYNSRHKVIPKYDNVIVDLNFNVKDAGDAVLTDDIVSSRQPQGSIAVQGTGSTTFGSTGKITSRKRYR